MQIHVMHQSSGDSSDRSGSRSATIRHATEGVIRILGKGTGEQNLTIHSKLLCTTLLEQTQHVGRRACNNGHTETTTTSRH